MRIYVPDLGNGFPERFAAASQKDQRLILIIDGFPVCSAVRSRADFPTFRTYGIICSKKQRLCWYLRARKSA